MDDQDKSILYLAILTLVVLAVAYFGGHLFVAVLMR